MPSIEHIAEFQPGRKLVEHLELYAEPQTGEVWSDFFGKGATASLGLQSSHKSANRPRAKRRSEAQQPKKIFDNHKGKG